MHRTKTNIKIKYLLTLLLLWAIDVSLISQVDKRLCSSERHLEVLWAKFLKCNYHFHRCLKLPSGLCTVIQNWEDVDFEFQVINLFTALNHQNITNVACVSGLDS